MESSAKVLSPAMADRRKSRMRMFWSSENNAKNFSYNEIVLIERSAWMILLIHAW